MRDAGVFVENLRAATNVQSLEWTCGAGRQERHGLRDNVCSGDVSHLDSHNRYWYS